MGTDSHPAEVQPGQTLEVVRHAGERFYELVVDGQFGGLVVYEEAGSRYVLTHTFIAEGFRGRGLSQVLLRGVLDDLRARHVTVTNFCPVVERFISRNPEYLPLIDAARPGRWAKDQ
jgi:predicted GNAT family acetyltransferase